MKTLEEKRKYDRERMSKWLTANPDKREKNRLKNIKWRKLNREKCRIAAVNYRKNHPGRVKNYRLKVNYGITIEDYLVMHKRQKGKCAICKNPEKAKHNGSKKVQQLAVDHCHKTGKVRALLCQDCNRGLGKFYDDPKRLKIARDYILFHSFNG